MGRLSCKNLGWLPAFSRVPLPFVHSFVAYSFIQQLSLELLLLILGAGHLPAVPSFSSVTLTPGHMPISWQDSPTREPHLLRWGHPQPHHQERLVTRHFPSEENHQGDPIPRGSQVGSGNMWSQLLLGESYR